MKITKEMIINNYNKTMLFWFPNGRRCYEENKAAGAISFNKKEGCRYYLYPTYMDITDYFTGEEIFHNFYLGDIAVLDFNKYPDTDPKKIFVDEHGDEWTKEYGLITRWFVFSNVDD